MILLKLFFFKFGWVTVFFVLICQYLNPCILKEIIWVKLYKNGHTQILVCLANILFNIKRVRGAPPLPPIPQNLKEKQYLGSSVSSRKVPPVAKDFSQTFCEPAARIPAATTQFPLLTIYFLFIHLSIYLPRSLIAPMFWFSSAAAENATNWQLLIWPQLSCWFDQIWTDLTAAMLPPPNWPWFCSWISCLPPIPPTHLRSQFGRLKLT